MQTPESLAARLMDAEDRAHALEAVVVGFASAAILLAGVDGFRELFTTKIRAVDPSADAHPDVEIRRLRIEQYIEDILDRVQRCREGK
jgi:hypothetical protein